MNKIKDNGVSPVIGTILLVALSIILISLVSVSVMSAVGSFTPVENKVVGFTVQVNASNNSALVTPVSGTDLPFLESYRVYTNNGHWDKPDAGNITVPMFNSSVTYVNIVGNFTDRITALVFSGKVVVEGGVVVVESPDGPPSGTYYEVGTEPYANASEFADSLNDWWHVLHPGSDIAYLQGNQLALYGNITIANEPITITPALQNMYPNTNSGGSPKITFFRAPGYDGPLLLIESGATNVDWNHGTVFTLDGNGGGEAPLLLIKPGASFTVATITLINNKNLNGNGGGIRNEGTFIAQNALKIQGNTAMNGAGLYNSGTYSGSGLSISGNTASDKGGGVYNSGKFTYNSGSISGNFAASGYNYYAKTGSTNNGYALYSKFSPAVAIPTTDQPVNGTIP